MHLALKSILLLCKLLKGCHSPPCYILQLPVVMSLVLQHLTSENCSPYLGNQPLERYETNALILSIVDGNRSDREKYQATTSMADIVCFGKEK